MDTVVLLVLGYPVMGFIAGILVVREMKPRAHLTGYVRWTETDEEEVAIAVWLWWLLLALVLLTTATGRNKG